MDCGPVPLRDRSGTGVVSDPDDPADEQFIVRLIGRITAVSLAILELLKGLPPKPVFVGLSSAEKVEAVK